MKTSRIVYRTRLVGPLWSQRLVIPTRLLLRVCVTDTSADLTRPRVSKVLARVRHIKDVVLYGVVIVCICYMYGVKFLDPCSRATTGRGTVGIRKGFEWDTCWWRGSRGRERVLEKRAQLLFQYYYILLYVYTSIKKIKK